LACSVTENKKVMRAVSFWPATLSNDLLMHLSRIAAAETLIITTQIRVQIFEFLLVLHFRTSRRCRAKQAVSLCAFLM
jgi:hypothetical protein